MTKSQFQEALVHLLTPTQAWKPALPLDGGEMMPIAKVETEAGRDAVFVTVASGERFVIYTAALDV